MSKKETSATGKKAAYISPRVVCCAVEYLLCSGSNPLDSGHKNAEFDGTLEEEP